MSEATVFAAALDRSDPAERAAFLAEACAGDEKLRRRVEALLRAHAEPDEILDAPSPCNGTVNYAPITEKPGTRIGPYILREQIGEGGFGLVFVAEQIEPVKRKVALKVIKPGMDSQQVIARFEAERQALALMDHPNIARVLDAGATESGRPYFVMELVRGIPITEYCDQNQLAPRDRLDLFITVCQAIQHAHQKGIIHRDIKPSNVLITSHDGKPVAKVIDFGVAKAIHQHLTERTIYTNFAQMIGTPLYMSPEQAEMSGLDIDTRSDIYSLGVLLYELLTGTTPLEKKQLREAAYDEIRRLIREEEPPKPSTRLSQSGESLPSVAAQRQTEPARLSRLMRGDLDWITMKALEKDRTRRYETANGLARDIQRYLGDEPVEACPPSATYRLRKFAKKNRTTLTTATTIAGLLVVGAAVSTWQAVRARRAEQAAVVARDAEAEQRHRAEADERKAVDAAAAEKQAKESAQTREAETKAVLQFVENKIFAAARPKDQEGGQGFEVKLVDAITAALPYVEKSFAAQPLIEARLRQTLGYSFACLGRADIAEQQYRRARDLYAATLGPDHLDTLRSMTALANSYVALGRHEEALPLHEEALKLSKSKLGPDHPGTISSMHNLGLSYAALGRHQEALALREETLKLAKAKFGPDHHDTLMSMNNLANTYVELGRHAEALKLREETLRLQKAKLGTDHPDTLMSMNNLANSYRTLGRHREALALREETLKLQQAKLGPDHPQTLLSMNNLAGSYADLGRHTEALALHEETLTLYKSKLGFDHPDTLMSMGNLASGYAALGRHAEAMALREETFRLTRAKLGSEHPDTLRSMGGLADSYAQLGRRTEALALREETLKLSKAKLGPDHPFTSGSMHNLANSYAQLGRHPEALALREETLKLRKAKLGPDHPDTLMSVANLASSYAALGRYAEVVALSEETLKLTKDKLGSDHAATLVSMNSLAISYAHLGRRPEALQLFEETLQLRMSKLGPDHPDTFQSMSNLTKCYCELGRYPEALSLREEMLRLWKAKLGANHPNTIGAIYDVACTHALMIAKAEDRSKQADLAMNWLQQAVAAGYKDAAHMKKDTDLDGLREREDFKKLIAELESKAPTETRPSAEKKP